MLFIESPHNVRIKGWSKLHKASERRANGLFLVEGLRELRRAVDAGWQLETFLFSDRAHIEGAEALPLSGVELIRCSEAALSKLIYREGPTACVGVVCQKKLLIHNLQHTHPGHELWVVVEGAEKPGNIGALLRSLDAVGASGLILCDPEADIFSPNVVRASTGALFSMPIAISDSKETLAWLRQRGCQIMAATPEGAMRYDQANLNQPVAIILGAESKGLSKYWKSSADSAIALPMCGAVDSLNLSTTAAVILYEALRQRTADSL